ncbi:MAG TPA: hypothetical protein VK171_10045 [Fimbriimonas sp.]|nr:hypothetical protein [Fimbriimonas sp.]
MLSLIALCAVAPNSTYYLTYNRLVIGSLRGRTWKSLETVPNTTKKISLIKVGIGTVGGERVAKGLEKGEPNMAGYLTVDEGYDADGILFSGPVRVPRKVEVLPNSNETYIAVVDKFIKSKGLNSAVNITRLVRADLDGDGKDEVLIEASNRDLSTPSTVFQVQPGDYSLVLLRTLKRGKVYEIPLMFDRPSKDSINYVNKIAAIADFDRNGSLDVMVTSRYYEGASATLFNLRGTKVKKLVEMGDGV